MRSTPKRILKRPRPGRPPFPDVDAHAAARVAELAGVVRIDGRDVPFVKPHRSYEDNAEFDAALCKAGVREFARATMPGDWPAFVSNPGPHVLVTQIRPGVRVRYQAMVTFDHEMN
jgi:hypothetical protein